MNEYKKIIACIDITGEEDQVIDRAEKIAMEQGAELSIVHVMRPLSYYYASDFAVDVVGLQKEMERRVRERMKELVRRISIKEVHQYIFVGSPKHEIHRLAEDIKADLVVIGTHGRNGMGLLLGSTANAVLHGTPCDVLVVRIRADATKSVG